MALLLLLKLQLAAAVCKAHLKLTLHGHSYGNIIRLNVQAKK